MTYGAEDRPDGAREFKFLNLNEILFTHTIGIFGRRGSGKTTVTMNILQAKTNIPRGLVMCPTPEAVIVYGEQIPISYIFDYFDENVLNRIMTEQYKIKLRLHHQYRQEIAQLEANAAVDRKNRWNQRMQALKQRQVDENLSARQVQIMYEREMLDEEFENKQNLEMRKQYARLRKMQLQEPYSMFCVLDDLSSDPDAIRSRVVKKLMDNGRHYLLLLLVICQYSMDFPAACRGGLDWVIIFFDTLAPNLKRLYENYVGEFPDQHIFREALAECARRNCCLVINKRSRSADLYESVFLFEPQEVWLSTKYLGDPNFEWVHNMFFSDQKFRDSMGGTAPQPGDKKGKKGKKVVKPPSKSFSIESIERKKGGKRGAGGKSKRGAKDDAPVDADEEEFDPEAEEERKKQQIIKQNVQMTRQKLKQMGKQAQAQAEQRQSYSQADLPPDLNSADPYSDGFGQPEKAHAQLQPGSEPNQDGFAYPEKADPYAPGPPSQHGSAQQWPGEWSGHSHLGSAQGEVAVVPYDQGNQALNAGPQAGQVAHGGWPQQPVQPVPAGGHWAPPGGAVFTH